MLFCKKLLKDYKRLVVIGFNCFSFSKQTITISMFTTTKFLSCIVIIFAITISSCHYPFIRIVSDERPCFSKKELIPLMDSYNIDVRREFVINSIVKTKEKCIGLYGYRFISARGGKVIRKALVFEDGIYFYHSGDSTLNQVIILTTMIINMNKQANTLFLVAVH